MCNVSKILRKDEDEYNILIVLNLLYCSNMRTLGPKHRCSPTMHLFCCIAAGGGSPPCVFNAVVGMNEDKDKWLSPCLALLPFIFSLSLLSFSLLLAPCCTSLSRMSADEDGEAEAQHIHHPLPAVDHCYWTHIPRGDSRGTVRYPNTQILRLRL